MGLGLGLVGICLSPAWTAEVVGQRDDFDTGVIETGEVLTEKALEENRVADVIGDQTMTLVGHGFMQGFQRAWRDHESNGESNIAVFERPSARWGSLVWVEQNFTRVYQTFLFPGRGDPAEVGESAARWVYQRVAEIEAAKLLFKDPDMEKEEF
ncbi:MAG TPA: CsgE family curli-type amyloid fiber assembly protein [Burkholderiales bacterium]